MYSIPSSERDFELSMMGRDVKRGGESGRPDPGNGRHRRVVGLGGHLWRRISKSLGQYAKVGFRCERLSANQIAFAWLSAFHRQ